MTKTKTAAAPTNGIDRRRWSARQRLVVLTFDTPKQADAFDRGGLIPVDALVSGFDLERVAERLLLDLMHACRDVIDAHDEQPHNVDGVRRVTERIEAMRRALFDLRQAALT